jgi:PTH2 family peptidyl-tRNA hydrolase
MKQVIVMRTDLRNTEGHKVRSGKLMAQAAHASMAAVLPYLQGFSGTEEETAEWSKKALLVDEWLQNSFTKVVVRAESEVQLSDVYTDALAQGLIAAPILDNGLTEFGGRTTFTCIAVGPDTDEKLAPVTGWLKLF